MDYNLRLRCSHCRKHLRRRFHSCRRRTRNHLRAELYRETDIDPYLITKARQTACLSLLLFHLAKAANDLADGKIISRFDKGYLFTAKVHHLRKKRQQIGTSSVRKQDPDVRGQARKAVFFQPVRLDGFKIAKDMLIRVRRQSPLHQP